MAGDVRSTCLLEIYAEEGSFPFGRSMLSNIFGGPSLANWKFSGRITGGDLRGSVEAYFGEFQMRYGVPIEHISGIDRKQAHDILRRMHQIIVKDGWRQIQSGPHWYSYRYVADTDILDRL